MKQVYKLTKVPFFLLLLLSTTSIFGQTTTWTGGTNQSWFTASNWSNGLPDATKEAIITDARLCVVAQFSNGIARKITIQDGATLRIQVGSPALNVAPDTNDIGVYVAPEGTLQIDGRLNITGASSDSDDGLYCEGLTNITGSLFVNNVGGDAVSILRHTNSFDDTGLGVIDLLDGLIGGAGQIRIGNSSSVGGDGIKNSGILRLNETDNLITIDNVGSNGIENVGQATSIIDSKGRILIGTNGGADNIAFQGVFNSHSMVSTGELTIRETGLVGLRTLTSQNFQLGGVTSIDATGGAAINNSTNFTLLGELNIGTDTGSIGGASIVHSGTRDLLVGTTAEDCSEAILRIGAGQLQDNIEQIVNNGTIIYEESASGTLGTNNGLVIANGPLTITTDNGTYLEGLASSNGSYWLGCTDSDWDEATNWIGDELPTADSDVVILSNATNMPELSTSAASTSVTVTDQASLVISSGGELTLEGNTDNMVVEAGGSLTIEGALNISSTTVPGGQNPIYGLLNNGTTTVSGTLSVEATKDLGIATFGNFTSTSTAQITISDTRGDGFKNEGTANLEGVISIDNTNGSGLQNTGSPSTVNLKEDLQLTITNTDDSGIFNGPNAIFNFQLTTGQVDLYDIGGDGILNVGTGQVSLEGKVNIGTLGSIAGDAINNSSAFTIIGSCNTLVTIGDGALIDNGQMVNNGTIIYEDTADGTLAENNGTVISTNGGTITITTNNGAYSEGGLDVWTGCSDTAWENGDNWVDGSVPTSSDEVLIPTGVVNMPSLNSTTTILKLDIQASAELLINSSGVLTLAGDDLSVLNDGVLTNNGALTINKMTDDEVAFENNGSLVNAGTIDITNGKSGIELNDGCSFENQDGATIEIKSTQFGFSSTSLNQSNEGLITVTDGFVGFSSFNTFTNSSTGIIEVDNVSATSFRCTDGFTNAGSILIGLNQATLVSGLEHLNGNFTNTTTGVINIASSSRGLQVFQDTFINNGSIVVDGSTGNGLEVRNSSVLNNNNSIDLGSNTPNAGGILVQGTFNNTSAGGATTSLTDNTTGINVQGTFENSGSFFTNADLIGSTGTSITGNGSFTVQGDWNHQGTTNLGSAQLTMSGTSASSITNNLAPLEVDEWIVNKSNGTITLNSDVTVNTDLTISNGLIDLNANRITLGTGAQLSGETETKYIFDSEGTGTGYIQSSETINNGLGVEPGNLGLILSTSADLGSVNVKRRHYQVNMDAVNRTFEYSSANDASGSDLELNFSYLEQELLGITDESSLGLFKIDNGNLSEILFTGISSAFNTVDYDGENLSGLQVAVAGSSRQIEWVGNTSSDWYDSTNWNLGGIPNENYNVLIPLAPNDPIIGIGGADQTIKSLYIEEDASLTNEVRLDIIGATSDALTLDGTFVNQNNFLFIEDAAGLAIDIGANGLLDNFGIIDLDDNLGNDTYINNTGEISNGGVITIDGIVDGAVTIFDNSLSGVVTNSGLITIGGDPNSQLDATYAFATAGAFTNMPFATLNVIYFDGIAFYNTMADFENSGTITIGQAAGATGLISQGIVNTDASFVNQDTGTILIDNVNNEALVSDRLFTNNGTISIGLNFPAAIGSVDHPALLFNDAFSNSGLIRIENTAGDAIAPSGDALLDVGVFTNSGEIYMGSNEAIAGNGIFIPSGHSFTNTVDGIVDMRNVLEAIENGGSFTNAGELFIDNSIGSSGEGAISGEGIFSNSGLLGGEVRNISLQQLGGTISPGFSPGLVTFDSSVAFDAGTQLIIELEGTSSNSPLEFDRIIVAGLINLNNVDLQVIQNYTPMDGDRIDFINASVIAGSFASASLPPGWELSVGPTASLTFNTSLLPVELTGFEAELVNDVVELSWETASEENNEGFEVQFSTDGANWTVLGFVQGNGDSSTAIQYRYVHDSPVEGDNYYRLKQLDFDGNFEYSPIEEIFLGLTSGVHVYPNPVVDHIKVIAAELDSIEQIEIYDNSGRVLKIFENVLSGEVIELSELPSGTYFILVRTQERTYVEKIIKLSS